MRLKPRLHRLRHIILLYRITTLFLEPLNTERLAFHLLPLISGSGLQLLIEVDRRIGAHPFVKRNKMCVIAIQYSVTNK